MLGQLKCLMTLRVFDDFWIVVFEFCGADEKSY